MIALFFITLRWILLSNHLTNMITCHCLMRVVNKQGILSTIVTMLNADEDCQNSPNEDKPLSNCYCLHGSEWEYEKSKNENMCTQEKRGLHLLLVSQTMTQCVTLVDSLLNESNQVDPVFMHICSYFNDLCILKLFLIHHKLCRYCWHVMKNSNRVHWWLDKHFYGNRATTVLG